MAFKMNRSVIQGTSTHKKSILLKKETSIVSQAGIQADSSLVNAGRNLGKSTIGDAIDYTLTGPKVEFKKEKGEKGNKKKRKSKIDGVDPTNETGMVDVMINGVKTSVPAKDRFKYESIGRAEKAKRPKKDKKAKKERVDKEGTVVSRLLDKVRTGADARKSRRADDDKIAQTEKDKLTAEKLKVNAAKEAELNKRLSAKNKLKEDKTTASASYTVNKRDLQLKGGNWVPKEGAVSKEDDHAIWDGEQWTDNPKYMDNLNVRPFGDEDVTSNKKKGIAYESGSIKADAFGEKSITSYSKEQLKSIQAGEGVWSDEAGREVLKEEIVDGKYVPLKPEVRIDESNNFSGDNQTIPTPEPVIEEPTQTTTKPTPSDFRPKPNAFGGTISANEQYRKALKEYHSKNPLQMRDDRIYKNAREGGPVRRNMTKGGYMPPSER
tara:strand:+ start:1391 stop:2698 length:1308 start_codon:yes stop_codon:yes gene_type:complete